MNKVVKRRRRRKNCLVFVSNKKERIRKFKKRKNALFKKGYELQTLTGCELLILATNEEDHSLYCFASPKFQTLLGKEQRKQIVERLQFSKDRRAMKPKSPPESKKPNPKLAMITSYRQKNTNLTMKPKQEKKEKKTDKKKKKKIVQNRLYFHHSHVAFPIHPITYQENELIKFRDEKEFVMESSLKPTINQIIKGTEQFIEKRIPFVEPKPVKRISKPLKKRKLTTQEKRNRDTTKSVNKSKQITLPEKPNPQKILSISSPSDLSRLLLEVSKEDKEKLDELGKMQQDRFEKDSSTKSIDIGISTPNSPSSFSPKFWKQYDVPLSLSHSKSFTFVNSPLGQYFKLNTPVSTLFKSTNMKIAGITSPNFSPLRKGKDAFSEPLSDENLEMKDFKDGLKRFSSFGDF